jgi:hypothetical protein
MRTAGSRPALSAPVQRVESASALDPIGKSVGQAARRAAGHGALKDALSGTWLGHAVHPVLTDVVMAAYDTFADAANTNALKVVLEADGSESPSDERVLAGAAVS